MADTCIFCKIIAKEIPAKTVHEDDHTLAFLDISPRAPGHVMVIPKHHSPTLIDLPDEEVGPLFLAVKHMAARLMAAMKADGMTIGINQGDVSGQTVKHLHVHLMPRFEGDKGGSIHSVVLNPPTEDLDAIRARLQGS
jgi:histidine triad (HIT) family protein